MNLYEANLPWSCDSPDASQMQGFHFTRVIGQLAGSLSYPMAGDDTEKTDVEYVISEEEDSIDEYGATARNVTHSEITL